MNEIETNKNTELMKLRAGPLGKKPPQFTDPWLRHKLIRNEQVNNTH